MDNVTRMVKLRIGVKDASSRLRAGMFATVRFGVSEGNSLSVPKAVMVTVQGKNYVFVKKNDTTFERREILAGAQVNNRVIVYRGLQEADAVVTTGTLQLKGISFGY